jgi:hypothetical protein
VACMGEGRNVYRVLVGKPKGKRLLGSPRRWWEDGIRLDLRDTGVGVVSGFTWLKMGTVGGLLWMRWWTFGSWRQGISILHSLKLFECKLLCFFVELIRTETGNEYRNMLITICGCQIVVCV